MRYGLKSILALFCLTLTMQFTASNAFAGTKKLTDAQCVIVRKALAEYIVLVKKILGNSPLANYLITTAQKDTDKVCPLPPPPPVDTVYECTVLSSDHTVSLPLSLDASGNFTDVAGAGQTVVCMTASACSNIVALKLNTFGPTLSPNCSDPNNTTVVHYTDAQVQIKADALPPLTP